MAKKARSGSHVACFCFKCNKVFFQGFLENGIDPPICTVEAQGQNQTKLDLSESGEVLNESKKKGTDA